MKRGEQVAEYLYPYWWARYKNQTGGRFIEARGKDAATAEAAKHGEVFDVRELPYPPSSSKLVNGFCYTPDQCAGRTCCPKSYACSE